MIKINRRFSLCPFAALAFAAVTLSASFADGQSGADNAPAPADRAAPGSKQEMPVDLSVSAQHAGRSNRDEAGAQQKAFKIAPVAQPKVHAATPSVDMSIVGRDAIGQPIMRPLPAQPPAPTALGHPPAQLSAPVASGIDNGRSAATMRSAVREASPLTPIPGRGRIGGSSRPRPGVLSGLGGPSGGIGGINGTTFATKR